MLEVLKPNQFWERDALEEVEVLSPLTRVLLLFDFELGEFLGELLFFLLEQLQVVQLKVLE